MMLKRRVFRSMGELPIITMEDAGTTASIGSGERPSIKENEKEQ